MQPLCIATDSKYEEREKWLTNKLLLPTPAEGGWHTINSPSCSGMVGSIDTANYHRWFNRTGENFVSFGLQWVSCQHKCVHNHINYKSHSDIECCKTY